MKNLFLILLGVLFLYSCGNSNFAKRKYMKGVYIEKHSHASSRKSKVESQKFKEQGELSINNDQRSAKVEGKKEKKEELSVINYERSTTGEEVLSSESEEVNDLDDAPNEINPSKNNDLEDTPPETQDGEVLTRSKSNSGLARASIITAYTSLGLILLGFLVLIIFAIAIYFSGGTATPFVMQLVSWIIYGIALALAAFALVAGSIVLSRDNDRRGLHGIIVGGIILFLFLLSLLIALII